MTSFFAFGNVAIDDLVFADGTTMWTVPGGAAVYAALGMAVWTERATTVAPFGPDYPRGDLARIDFACTRRLPRTMRNWGLYEDDGSRHFLPRRASEDWERFSPCAADLGPGPYTHCHLGPMPWARASELIAALRARGARTISADLYDRKLADVTLDAYLALAARIDVLLPSAYDVAAYLPGLDAVGALRALRAHLPGVAVIGVKCGREGAIVHAAGSDAILHVDPVTNDVVDATGAGDAFCGGFLAGFARGNDAADGALYGAVSASYALAATGPHHLVTAPIAEARERVAALRARMTTIPFAAS
jgi:sugar/nucleoside kinase (ribokinase family)